MNTYMNDSDLKELQQVREFLKGSVSVKFNALDKKEAYAWIAGALKRFAYHSLLKKNKGEVREYLARVTGYSRAHLNRLIAQYKKKRWIGGRRKARNIFATLYTREDILLLAETDECHQTLSGTTTKKLFERGYRIFEDCHYERLATISVAHIYNLRKGHLYQDKRRHFTKTQRTVVAIGERRKPSPNGQPGYLRIDTVHQGDLDGVKGVYYINAVDEVTQMEVVCAVEKISENCLIPVLEAMIGAFPFEIKGIHSDNGSEYINHRVVALLNKLFIELTKSRSRHSNDNALVESKNGSVVRKWLGYCHIQQKHAPKINLFLQQYFVPYINYHRPCHYAEVIVDEKTGKQRKKYPYKNMMTPYEKFKSLSHAKQYLKSGVTFERLDVIARKETDLEAARIVQEARRKLFCEISQVKGL
jgi:transposase InsO family protein